jgi:anti-sigma-K factor RskA
MPEHDHPHPDVAGYVLGVLEPDEAVAFRAHLAGCTACRDDVTELSGLGELLGEAAPPVDVPAGLEARTFAAVERATAEGGPSERPRRRRRPQTSGWRRMVAAAAAVVVIGLGVAVVRDTSRPEPAVAQVVELEAPGGGTAHAVARVQATPTGGVIEMEVDGLTPPPPGFFFECWLVSAQGDTPDRPNRVSVGTFTVDETGHASVRWDFKADTSTFPRMGVTLEPNDGNPVQTTSRVLAATRLL